jgi:ribosome biogenesis SPOUT family RNA methylase Rps3
MTTDTAVRVTRMVVQDKIDLDKISYIDHPELKVDAHESTEMPFRYVKGEDGRPVMPEVSDFYLLNFIVCMQGGDSPLTVGVGDD